MKNLLFTFFAVFVFSTLFSQSQYTLDNTIVVKVSHNFFHKKGFSNVRSYIESVSTTIEETQPLFKNFNYNKKDIPNEFDLSTIFKIKTDKKADIDELIRNLRILPEIIYAEPYYTPKILGVPNDPYIGSQYYMNNTKAFEAHNITKGDTNIVIGIVDTGTDFYHEDLQNNFAYNYNDPINGIDDDNDGYIDNFKGWDIADNDNNPQFAKNAHGVMVSGLASAATNNGLGISGMGYNTRIMSIKVIKDSQNNSIVGGYEGIVYAADHGCSIINCSWGSPFKSSLADDVINYAVNYKKCLVVAAAGNDKNNIPFYPAACDFVLNVTATDVNDHIWIGNTSGSTYGIFVDICAPGSNMFTTLGNNSYGSNYISGTSFAAPLVAGAAALLTSVRPQLSPLQLAEQLRISSDIIDTIYENQYYHRQLGYGRLNAFNAIKDSLLPSVRVSDFNAETLCNNDIQISDTLTVSYSLINYLAQATNTLVRLTSNSDFLHPVNNVVNIASLGTMESFNSSADFRFLLDKDMPYDEKVVFTFEMQGQGYNDYQQAQEIVKQSFINVSNQKILTTLSSNGMIGYADEQESVGEGFVLSNHGNILAEAGICIATDVDNVLSTFNNESDFVLNQLVDTQTVSGVLQGLTKYEPKDNLWQHHVGVSQKTELFLDDEKSNGIIYEFTIENNSSATISNLRMGVFADWNLFGANGNKSEFIEDYNLFYTYSNSGRVLYAGIVYLGVGAANPYGFDMVEGGNGGIDITNSFSDQLKWFTMTNRRPFAGNDGDTLDVATFLTSGSYVVGANQLVSIPFALVTGSTYLELIKTTQSIIDYYKMSAVLQTGGKDGLFVYPNPAKDYLNIALKENECILSVKVYNSSGKLHISGNKNVMNLVGLNSGIYLLKIKTDKDLYFRKIVISQ